MITILTPTYNREKTLPRLFQSLMEQSSYDFEWLVIDDGSSDGTEKLVSEYRKLAPFQIRYIKKFNGGKHTALNIGFKEAEREWIIVVDSDDWLEKDCVDFIVRSIEEHDSFVGAISFLKRFDNSDIIGDSYDFELNNFLEREQLQVKGDKADVFRKSCLKEFNFPEFKGENFMAESPLYLWYGSRWNTSFYNYAGCICEYQEDGLSANSIKNRYICHNSTSYVYEYQWKMFTKLSRKSRAAINWWRFNQSKRKCEGWKPSFIFFVPGLLLNILDRLRLNL